MKLTITCPTRSRLKSVERFINSAFDLADNPDDVEIIFSYDSDDIETKEFFQRSEYQKPNIVVRQVEMTPEIIENGINIHNLYFNPSARMAKGKYVWGTGNDVEFITPGYDSILEEEIERFLADKPDRIAYIIINHDALVSSIQWCAFPVFTKESINIMNGSMPDEITSWGADKYCWVIYNSLCQPRILNIADKVAVRHWSYHTGRKHREDEVGSGGCEGDSISYRLSTKVQYLTNQQLQNYISKFNAKIQQNI